MLDIHNPKPEQAGYEGLCAVCEIINHRKVVIYFLYYTSSFRDFIGDLFIALSYCLLLLGISFFRPLSSGRLFSINRTPNWLPVYTCVVT